jgi:hypothetical protein
VEIKTVFGVPAHPLLVHVPIVLLPLVGVGAVACALSRRARRRFGPLVVGLAAVAFLGTLLAASSGEALEGSVDRTRLLHEHTEHAGMMRPLAFVLLLAVGALVAGDWLERRGRRLPAGSTVAAAVVAVGIAVGANAWLVVVGHEGARATWNEREVPARGREAAHPVGATGGG